MVGVVGMSWFRRREPQKDILQTLLEIEAKKAEVRGNLELRRLELESETIEARAKADIELREWKARQRERGRQQGLRNAAKKRRRNGTWITNNEEFCCELGADPNTRNVTVEMIKAHRLHEAGQSNNPDAPDTSQTGGPELPQELLN